jgi:hypothetical protein
MADERQHKNASVLLSMQIGQAGADNITDTSAHTPTNADEWYAIHALEDSVISSLTESNASGNLAGKTILGGDVLFGSFTAITLTSGTVRCYREPKT